MTSSHKHNHFPWLTACLVSLSAGTILIVGWTASRLYCEHRAIADKQRIDELNQIVAVYKQKQGKCPDLNLVDLYHKGLTEQRLHRTPFGGYYRLDPKELMVYNPNR